MRSSTYPYTSISSIQLETRLVRTGSVFPVINSPTSVLTGPASNCQQIARYHPLFSFISPLECASKQLRALFKRFLILDDVATGTESFILLRDGEFLGLEIEKVA
ncbi:hypothetical protein TNCV_5014901 [Trichonephila clavipes]|nr:hypothetical protein TNCV_5014901 [Trichonephila clavipes]